MTYPPGSCRILKYLHVYKFFSDIKIQKLKQQYFEIGSKSAKFLAYKLKRQQNERVIYKIKDPTSKGIKSWKFTALLKSITKFFILEGPTKDTLQPPLLNSLNIPEISDKQNTEQLAEETKELVKAINRLKSNKSPGSDGYTAEWYKIFKELLIPLLQ